MAPPNLPQPNLRRAFGGVWRLTWPRYAAPPHALTALGVIAALGLLTWVQARHAQADIVTWLSQSYLSFFVPLFAFVSAGGTLRDELKSSSTDYVLTRAIPRPAFVVFKFISHVAITEIEFLIAWAVIAGVGIALHIPTLGAALPTLLLGQSLLVLGFTAFGFLAAALTSRYIFVGLLYGSIVEIGVGQIPTQLNRLSMTHQVRQLLDPYLSHDAGAAVISSGAVVTSAVLLLITACALALAVAVFALRELNHSAES
jgi:hypothetical protein